jgi:hypothetical protein
MGRYAENPADQHFTTHSAAIAPKIDPGPSRWPEKNKNTFQINDPPDTGNYRAVAAIMFRTIYYVILRGEMTKNLLRGGTLFTRERLFQPS